MPKQFKLPRSVVIGGVRFDVVVRDLEEWGNMSFDRREIVISSRASECQETTRETMRHEMMHAAFAVGGVAFSEKWEEEAAIRCLEHLFFPAWDKLTNQ